MITIRYLVLMTAVWLVFFSTIIGILRLFGRAQQTDLWEILVFGACQTFFIIRTAQSLGRARKVPPPERTDAEEKEQDNDFE